MLFSRAFNMGASCLLTLVLIPPAAASVTSATLTKVCGLQQADMSVILDK